jgi:hypothetical protein
MEGPGQVFYGSAPAAAAAASEAIDAHGDQLAAHTADIATANAAITATNTTVAAINQVPSGLIAAVATAAGIPSGWTRYTNADGRMLIGAGTTFSQTFTENTAVGANWTPFAGGSAISATAADQVTVAIPGTQAVSATSHQHSVTLAAQTWTPVARVVVHVIKT